MVPAASLPAGPESLVWQNSNSNDVGLSRTQRRRRQREAAVKLVSTEKGKCSSSSSSSSSGRRTSISGSSGIADQGGTTPVATVPPDQGDTEKPKHDIVEAGSAEVAEGAGGSQSQTESTPAGTKERLRSVFRAGLGGKTLIGCIDPVSFPYHSEYNMFQESCRRGTPPGGRRIASRMPRPCARERQRALRLLLPIIAPRVGREDVAATHRCSARVSSRPVHSAAPIDTRVPFPAHDTSHATSRACRIYRHDAF